MVAGTVVALIGLMVFYIVGLHSEIVDLNVEVSRLEMEVSRLETEMSPCKEAYLKEIRKRNEELSKKRQSRP
jgi:predicted ATP-grasp superfamily ATP-dependent carboligase